MNATAVKIASTLKGADEPSIRVREYAAGLVILVLATLIFCFPIFQGKSFNVVGRHMFVQYPWLATVEQDPQVGATRYFQTDAAETYYPYFGFLTKTIRNGELPLWMPGVFGGQPLEILLGGIYYPPRLLLMPFFSAARQMDILLIVHLLLAGMGMFFFLQTWKAGFFGALFGALVWEFSGHQATWLLFPSPVAAAAWLPITLIGATLAIQKRSWRWAVICGTGLGLVLLAGDLHFPYVNGLLLAVWYLLLIALQTKPQQGSASIKAAKGMLIYPLLSAVVALLISLPGWLPLLLAFPYLHREAYTLDAQLWGLDYVFPSGEAVLRALVYPRDYAVDVGLPSSIFIGLPALLMLPFAFLRKSRIVTFFGLAGLFAFVILLGFRPVISALQYLLPLFSVFHLHRAWTYLLVITMTLLAAFGFDELIHQLGERFGNRSLFKWTGMFALMLEAFILISVMRSITPLQPEREDWLYPVTPLIRKLQTVLGEYRMLPVYDRQEAWTAPMFAGSTSILFGLRSGGGYQSLLPYDSVFLWKTVQLGGIPATYADLPPNSYRPYYDHDRIPLSLLEKLSVAYLVTPPGVRPRGPDGTDLEAAGQIRLIYEGPDGWIYQNDRALPRAFIVPHVEVISDPRSALERLTDPKFDARDTAIASVPLPKAESNQLSTRTDPVQQPLAEADIIEDRTTQITINTESPEAGILILNDTWWPGWRVYVDGVEQTIMKVNFAFRGVFLSAGAHQVEFVYRPVPLLVSLGISALTLALTILLVAAAARHIMHGQVLPSREPVILQ